MHRLEGFQRISKTPTVHVNHLCLYLAFLIPECSAIRTVDLFAKSSTAIPLEVSNMNVRNFGMNHSNTKVFHFKISILTSAFSKTGGWTMVKIFL